jgi:putative tricarboxylic transport membrane protein
VAGRLPRGWRPAYYIGGVTVLGAAISMKINDLLTGALLLALSVVLALQAWTLPNPSAQPLGPGAFPLLLAALLGLSSVFLLVGSVRDENRGALVSLAAWTRSPSHLARFFLVPLAGAFYILFAETLGFLPAAFSILLALFLSLRLRVARAAGLSAAAALMVHSIFYFGLGVQLPWGLLDPIRW